MATAILKIDGDASGLARAFGDIRAQAKATEAAIKSSMSGAFTGAEKAAQRAEGAVRRGGRVARDESARTSQQQERDAQRTVAAFLRAEDQKRRAAQLTAKSRARAEQEATNVARAEAQKRGLTAEQEARLRQSTLERVTRAQEAAERRQTATVQRETRERAKMMATVSRGANHVITAGFGAAREAHGQIQDARRQRATSGRTLDQAVRNAGGSEAEVASARQQVRAFVEQTGMSFSDVAGALAVGQERGSSLQAGAGETQADATRRALSLIREANAEGADPGQYLAARGRLAESGLTGDALKTAMRFALGAAQAGQVEVDQIIGQGLPGASRLMAQRVGALGPNASEEERQRARLNAWRESVSTQEVLAASGSNAGHTANTLASLQNFISTPRRQEMALTNIKAAERQINTSTPEGRARAAQLRSLYEGENSIFETDPTRRNGAMRLRQGVGAAEFATRVATATGGNAQTAANIFAGGGHGNAQAFLSNMRDLMAVLGSERGQRIQQMMQGGGVTDEQVARHENAVESDDLANLTRAEEAGVTALTNNTSVVTKLSNGIGDWLARNPLAAPVVGAALPLAGRALGALGAKAIPFAGAALTAIDAANGVREGRSASSIGLDVVGDLLPGGSLLSRIFGGGATAAGVAGRASGGSGGGGGAMQVRLSPDDHAAIGQQTAAALRAAPITATVSPVDQAHATAQAPVPTR